MTVVDDPALRYELDALRALAARVIDEHVAWQGTCQACGWTFPCPRACLAEHNLQICGDKTTDSGGTGSESQSVAPGLIARVEQPKSA